MIGRHLVKSFSKQQKVVALSSAEAETYALVLASCETLGIQAYAADLGIVLSAEMFADASAALGIIARAGLGKVRHLRTQALWLQETRQEGRLKFTKVPGEANPADAGTKYMAAPLLDKHVAAMGAKFQTGRAASAPDLKSIEVEEESERTVGRHTDSREVGNVEQDSVPPSKIPRSRAPAGKGSEKVRSNEFRTSAPHGQARRSSAP